MHMFHQEFVPFKSTYNDTFKGILSILDKNLDREDFVYIYMYESKKMKSFKRSCS